MKISFDYPPNIEQIRAVLTPPDTACFCYGDTIYNPSKRPISADLALHEGTHTRQQGDTPDEWWKEYLANPAFRLLQEIEAYRVQYRFVSQTIKNRDRVALRLHHMALDLASDMYGKPVSYNEARRLIRV